MRGAEGQDNMAFVEVRQDAVNVPQEVCRILLADEDPFDAEGTRRRLKKLRISSRPFFWQTQEESVFIGMACCAGGPPPAAERLAWRGFYIARGLALTEGQIFEVAERIK